MQYENTLDFARQQDQQDPLRRYRDQFIFPQHEGESVLYFCGNSLGLQPKTVRPALLAELDQWATYGVEGHFRGDLPWMYYHKFLSQQSARLVGAQPHEVVVMNTLTVNLHLMMVSFYRPTPDRYKIVMEAGAFPSDQYAMETQVRWHGFDPADAIVEVAPRPGEDHLRTEDIVAQIEKNGDQVAVVLFGGVNYYTGQFFDLPAIAAAAHRVGAYAGFDLAHAAGNLPLELHDWNADFAVWCSYKYLNSGPGGPSGAFVHERHGNNPGLPRFAGWWGHDESERFQMRKGFKPMRGAEGWQLSNAQILSFAAHKASLEIFDAAGMAALREKSRKLTGFLEFVLDELSQEKHLFRIITPRDPDARGSQISALTDDNGKALFDYLTENGVITDWREPNVIRFAPVPLYNSFEDVWRMGQLVRQARPR
ncbi:MAG: kynureninase [Bacteroidetes bacterium]|nr:MAG: kynureninase [Bacteroidota bacterium]